MQVLQRQSFNADGQTQIFEVRANGQHALVFSIAWLDLPGEVGIFPVLTNDLDLKVGCVCARVALFKKLSDLLDRTIGSWSENSSHGK